MLTRLRNHTHTVSNPEEGTTMAEMMFTIALLSIVSAIYLTTLITSLNASVQFGWKVGVQQQIAFADTFVASPNMNSTTKPIFFRAVSNCELNDEENVAVAGLQVIPPTDKSCVVIEGHGGGTVYPDYNAEDYDPLVDKIEYLLPSYTLTVIDPTLPDGTKLVYTSADAHTEVTDSFDL